MKLLIVTLIALLTICFVYHANKKENYVVSQPIEYNRVSATRSRPQVLTSSPINVFDRIEREEPILPNEIQIKQTYNTCMQNGGTLKGCLSEASAGLNTNVCKSLCHELVSPLSPYCTNVCTDQMVQQRNSCASGAC